MDTITNVVDNHKVSYEVFSKIGEGSQGVTFLLKDKSHIAKLFKGDVNPTVLKSKINFLINLGLDKRYYAVPLQEIVAPKSGYISEFASGMIPLTTLKAPGKGEDFSEWYVKTGGLLKRYGVLIKLAMAIRALHAKGLVYCDLSPNNVFISEESRKHNVFLIDMDNVRYKTSIIHNIFTPFYGAPEVVKSLAPNSPMSDCYSFAVIAYELLALNHPLIGDLVTEGEPEMEEKAINGELPWVEDSKDGSNMRTTGFPSDYFITAPIQKLFHRTFEEGLNDPMRRPSIGEWVDALNDGLNELLSCKTCNTHYPYRNNHHCPFCEQGPAVPFSIKIMRWEKVTYYDAATNQEKDHFELQPMIQDELFIDEKTTKYIKAFHLLWTYDDYDTPVAQVKIKPFGNEAVLTITPENDFVLMFKIPEINREETIDRERIIRFNPSNHKQMILGLNPFNQPQRVLVI